MRILLYHSLCLETQPHLSILAHKKKTLFIITILCLYNVRIVPIQGVPCFTCSTRSCEIYWTGTIYCIIYILFSIPFKWSYCKTIPVAHGWNKSFRRKIYSWRHGCYTSICCCQNCQNAGSQIMGIDGQTIVPCRRRPVKIKKLVFVDKQCNTKNVVFGDIWNSQMLLKDVLYQKAKYKRSRFDHLLKIFNKINFWILCEYFSNETLFSRLFCVTIEYWTQFLYDIFYLQNNIYIIFKILHFNVNVKMKKIHYLFNV